MVFRKYQWVQRNTLSKSLNFPTKGKKFSKRESKFQIKLLHFSKISQKKSYHLISLVPGKAEISTDFQPSILLRFYQLPPVFLIQLCQRRPSRNQDFILTGGNEIKLHFTCSLNGNLYYYKNEEYNKSLMNGLNH